MVARALSLAGLDLGDERHMVPADPSNPDGYWEHIEFVRLNEAVLDRFDAAWDMLPARGASAEMSRLTDLADEARLLLASFDGVEPWAWKDPRNSLTLPFWMSVVPNLHVIICVRNPLDVALSMQRRGTVSYRLGLALWEGYYSRLLAAAPPDRAVVTHFDSYFEDAASELARVLTAVGVQAPPEVVAAAAASVKPSLRHSDDSMADIRQFGIPSQVTNLYDDLVQRAGREPVPASPGRRTKSTTAAVDRDRLELELLRRSVTELKARLAQRVAELRQEGTARESLARELATRPDSTIATRDVTRALAAVLAETEEIHDILHDLHRKIMSPGHELTEWELQVQRARRAIRPATQPGATIAVISGGDDNLVRLPNRTGWHFPASVEGFHLGFHPGTSLSAIAQLESIRAKGATHLAIPEPKLWWLSTYPDFAAHLDRWYHLVPSDPACQVWSLESGVHTPSGALTALLASWSQGRAISLLDLTAAGLPPVAFGDIESFQPTSSSAVLPYADASIDAVAYDEEEPLRSEDARRVARLGVLCIRRNGWPTVTWQATAKTRNWPKVSVILPVFGEVALTAACLDSLGRTLPSDVSVEVLLIDDGSPEPAAKDLVRLAGSYPWVTYVRNAANLGFIATANHGAELASGEMLVFLNNDTVLLPTWLEPLLATFEEWPDAGAVGGRLLYPDGRLQEAGGLVFRDGSAAKVGYGDLNPERPLYSFVREAHYCSGALLVTPKDLFDALGGFDRRFGPAYYEDTDYCFRIRDKGLAVYYQPLSTIVHVEGGTAGNDLTVGHKRHQVTNQATFYERWRDMLADHPERPSEPFEEGTLLSWITTPPPRKAAR